MSKKIFAVNAGSSSLKFQLLDMPSKHVIAKGIFEKIGSQQGIFTMEFKGRKEKELLDLPSHQFAVQHLLDALLKQQVIRSLDEIDGVGHRVAHGGESFGDSVYVDERVMSIIEELAFLAPSHNPVNLTGIAAFKKALPQVGNVAVFDTAFHQSLRPEFFCYPIPSRYYERYQIRKYGFHGTSHQYIAEKVAALWEEQGESAADLRIISCHLGNGASICAIKNGCSVNTSMGFTPLAGLMMGSRSGDIDPMILPFLMQQEGLTAQAISDLLNKESGLLAVSQLSNDVRDIVEASQQGDGKAALALQMFVNRIAQTVAAYITDLAGLDALVFTAGIGEHSALIREMVINKLNCLGLFLNPSANEQGQLFIQNKDSKAKILIVPTDEELMIAQDTMRILELEQQSSEIQTHKVARTGHTT
ncbi:acetate/propionate family kinase [Streptococcus panodentis]|uniref:Acetate kinase n=1 Tax=Streptococcus panodentis TaxID=1581472 RepID=A0ABS5AXK9_9STRE|nr:acetate kinase [Streptococcus panodentis]MBP2621309.1 acetate kinase [Streptococcus panodentis]